jgi:hypothetical protein
MALEAWNSGLCIGVARLPWVPLNLAVVTGPDTRSTACVVRSQREHGYIDDVEHSHAAQKLRAFDHKESCPNRSKENATLCEVELVGSRS